MHLALQIAPVLAAEKSKTPFYIAGGVLVLWALAISLGVGMRNVRFPESEGQQRSVMAISVVLVLAAMTTAVTTAGTPAKTGEGGAGKVNAGERSTTPHETTPAPAKTTATETQPTATTGTPPPPSSPAAKGQKIGLSADTAGQLAYDKTRLSAKAGTVTIEFSNASPLEHNVTVEQGNKKLLGATPTFSGGKRTLTLKLAPGTYTFFCSVPGHRQAGMEGKLTVSS